MKDFVNPTSEVRQHADIRLMKQAIRVQLEAAEESGRKSLNHFRRAGEELIRLKGVVGHGKFKPLLDELGISKSSAANYMLISKEWEKVQRAGSLREAMKFLTGDVKEKEDEESSEDTSNQSSSNGQETSESTSQTGEDGESSSGSSENGSEGSSEDSSGETLVLCSKCLREGPKEGCEACERARRGEAEEEEEEKPPPTPEERMKEKNSELEKWCRQLKKFGEEMPDDPWLQELGKREGAQRKIEDCAKTVRSAKGYKICPKCDGKGCPTCRKTGWLTQYAFQQM